MLTERSASHCWSLALCVHFISETALIAFAVRSFGFSSAMLPSSRCSASDLKARQAEGAACIKTAAQFGQWGTRGASPLAELRRCFDTREGGIAAQAESSMNNTRSGVRGGNPPLTVCFQTNH